MSINSQYGAEEHGSGVYGGKRIIEETGSVSASGQTIVSDTTNSSELLTTTGSVIVTTTAYTVANDNATVVRPLTIPFFSDISNGSATPTSQSISAVVDINDHGLAIDRSGLTGGSEIAGTETSPLTPHIELVGSAKQSAYTTTNSVEYGTTIGSVGPATLESGDGAQAESATLDLDGRGEFASIESATATDTASSSVELHTTSTFTGLADAIPSSSIFSIVVESISELGESVDAPTSHHSLQTNPIQSTTTSAESGSTIASSISTTEDSGIGAIGLQPIQPSVAVIVSETGVGYNTAVVSSTHESSAKSVTVAYSAGSTHSDARIITTESSEATEYSQPLFGPTYAADEYTNSSEQSIQQYTEVSSLTARGIATNAQSITQQTTVSGADHGIVHTTPATTTSGIISVDHLTKLFESGYTRGNGTTQTTETGSAQTPLRTIGELYSTASDSGNAISNPSLLPTLVTATHTNGVGIESRDLQIDTINTAREHSGGYEHPTPTVGTYNESSVSTWTGGYESGIIEPGTNIKILDSTVSNEVGIVAGDIDIDSSVFSLALDTGTTTTSLLTSTFDTAGAIDQGIIDTTGGVSIQTAEHAVAIDATDTSYPAQFSSTSTAQGIQASIAGVSVIGTAQFRTTDLTVGQSKSSLPFTRTVSGSDTGIASDTVSSVGTLHTVDVLTEFGFLTEQSTSTADNSISILESADAIQTEQTSLLIGTESMMAVTERTLLWETAETVASRRIITFDNTLASVSPSTIQATPGVQFTAGEYTTATSKPATSGQTTPGTTELGFVSGGSENPLISTTTAYELDDLGRSTDSLNSSIGYTVRSGDVVPITSGRTATNITATVESVEGGLAQDQPITHVQLFSSVGGRAPTSESLSTTSTSSLLTLDSGVLDESPTLLSRAQNTASAYSHAVENKTTISIKGVLFAFEFYPRFNRTFTPEFSDFDKQITGDQHIDQYQSNVLVKSGRRETELTASNRTVDLRHQDIQTQTTDVDVTSGQRTVSVQST